MSLVVTLSVRDGLVIAADRRGTIDYEDKRTQYTDDECKIIPFDNNMVVAFVGCSQFTYRQTVRAFLCELKAKSQNMDALQLAQAIYEACVRRYLYEDATFKFVIAGITDDAPDIYRVSFNSKATDACDKIRLETLTYDNPYIHFAMGAPDVAKSILKDVNCESLSFGGAVDLATLCVKSTCEAYKYKPNQIVGGDIDVYAINFSSHQCGWVNHYEPRLHADNDFV